MRKFALLALSALLSVALVGCGEAKKTDGSGSGAKADTEKKAAH